MSSANSNTVIAVTKCIQCGLNSTENEVCVSCSKRVFDIWNVPSINNELVSNNIGIDHLIDNVDAIFGSKLVQAYQRLYGCDCLIDQCLRYGLSKNALPVQQSQFDDGMIRHLETKLRVRRETDSFAYKQWRFLGLRIDVDFWTMTEAGLVDGTVIMAPKDHKLSVSDQVGLHYFAFSKGPTSMKIYVLKYVDVDTYDLILYSAEAARQCWKQLRAGLEIIAKTIGFMYDNPSDKITTRPVEEFLIERGYMNTCKHTYDSGAEDSDGEQNSC